MELAELILKYVDTLKYPALLIFVFIYFRNQLRLLLSGKLSAKYKDLELTLEQTSEELQKSRDLKQVIVEDIESKLAELAPVTSQKPLLATIGTLLDKLKQDLSYWEALVLEFVMLCDRQPVPKYWVVEGLIGNSDPWRKHKDEDLVLNAIKYLITKGLIQKEIEGKSEYFRVHPLLSEKKT